MIWSSCAANLTPHARESAALLHHLIRRGLAALMILAAVGGATPAAQAAGLFLPGRGVKPLGRAGAFVASGEGDLNSLWYNPANLAALGGSTLTVDLALVDLEFEFERAPRVLPSGEIERYEAVRNEASPQAIPQILVGGRLPLFGSDKLAWAFGLYAPYLSPHTFPEDGPQRYVLVDNNGSALGYMHLAVGYAINDHIRLGAGLQNMVADFTVVNVTSGYAGVFGDPEDRDLDILSRIRLSSYFNLTGNVGAWIRISPWLQGAISAQLPVTVRDDAATMQVRLPSHPAFDDASLDGDTLRAGLSFPFIGRAALRVVRERFDYELAFVYEGWSAFKEIQADPNDVFVRDVRGLGSIRVAPLSIPMNYRDTFSVRNGFELKLREALSVRTGYLFETGAVPDEYYSAFLAEGDKHVLTLGGSFRGASWSVDASLAYHLIGDRSISNSRVRQLNPTDTGGEYTLVVADGEYSQRYLIFGAGFNLAF